MVTHMERPMELMIRSVKAEEEEGSVPREGIQVQEQSLLEGAVLSLCCCDLSS